MTTSDGGNGASGSSTSTCSGVMSGGDGELSLLCSSHHHSEDRLWGAVEILPQRLYYAPLRFFPPEEIEEDDATSTIASSKPSKTKQQEQLQSKSAKTKEKRKPIHYFSIDNELVYWNFFLDFGPLNLGHLYRFCEMLNNKLSSPAYQDHIICYYSGAEGTKRANATYLICAYQMLYLGRTLEESYFGFYPEEREEEEEEGEGEEDEDDEGRKRRRKWWRQHRIRTSLPNSAMAAHANSDDEEIVMKLSNVSLPPQQQHQEHQSRRHFSHRLTGRRNSSGDRAGKSTLSQSTTKCPFVPIHPLPPYHDASPIICTYDLTVYDCLAGLQKARQFGFFEFGNTFITASTPTTPTASTDIMDNNNDTTTTTTTTPRPLFDIDEYEYFEQVENGDLNWIIENKILAFAGPLTKKNTSTDNTNTEGMYYNLTPAEYIPYFQKRNVQLVIRLNNASCYDEREFTDAGIQHVTHYYMDGSCPTMDILFAVVADMERVINRGENDNKNNNMMTMMEFEEEQEEGGSNEAEGDDDDDDMKQIMVDDAMEIGKEGKGGGGEGIEESSREGGGAVAVHCKAGLGRTGTCIGAYIMKHYKFTAAEVIGYMRICRPGMVIGPQQHFLASIESLMWQEGDVYRLTIEQLRGINTSNEESGELRKMSIDSNDGDDGEEEGGGCQQLHQQATTTPQAKNSSGCGVSGGAHVSIVTPDGQPFRLLTTPVNARKMHINSSLVDNIDSSPISSPAMLQPRPIPLSTNMEESKVTLIDIELANDKNMQEGDQANELLSRRMNRHQVKHQST